MQGDKSVLDTLNQLLKGELTAIDQYLIHGELYADMGFKVLADKALHESEHERTHAQALIRRILFLQGTPDISQRDPLKVGKTPEEMLASDLALEYKVAQDLKAAITLCEQQKDFVTRDMLRLQLEDTECDHAYYLEKQLRLIKSIGLQNYLQSQMQS